MDPETLEKIDHFYSGISDWIVWIVELFRTAWNHPYAPDMLGIALILLCVLVMYRKIRKRYAPMRLFDNRVGVVEVSRSALDELVQSVCYSMGAINRPEVDIYTHFGRLCMRVSLKLESSQKLTEASAYIQTALTTAFREYLGVEKLGRIDVRVVGFKGLIYKPEHKFLPPSSELEKESSDIAFDALDDSKQGKKDPEESGGILP